MQINAYMVSQRYLLQRTLKAAYQRQTNERTPPPALILEGVSENKHRMENSLNPTVGSRLDVMI